jgi:hypothetical protein
MNDTSGIELAESNHGYFALSFQDSSYWHPVPRAMPWAITLGLFGTLTQ